MATDSATIENIAREGIVHAVDPVGGTVRVVFPDKEGSDGSPLPSGPLRVLVHGSGRSKQFWMPQIGDQVACVFLTNSTGGNNVGWVVGSFYSEADTPPTDAAANKRIIEHNGDLEIRCSGNVAIHGARVDINT